MKKIDINLLIQLLGMVGIICSLIFVGLEMRQTQRIAIAGQQQARASANMDRINAFIESGIDHHAVSWELDFEYDRSDPEIAFRNNTHGAWHLYENDFYSYENGLMEESTWAAKLAGIGRLYNICLRREIYIARTPLFAQEFREIIESFPDECAG